MDTIALAYVGGGAVRSGLPARDIDRAEIEALASARKLALEDFVAQLVDTGLYRAIGDVDEAAAAAEDAGPALSSLTKPKLLELVEQMSIDITALGKRPTNAQLVEAIEAEQKRLADEAAEQAKSSDSGEGDTAQERLAKLSDDELAVVAQKYEVDASGLERDALIEAIATKAGYAPAASDQA